MNHIPKTQFHLFVLTNKRNSVCGIFQTFGQAYQRMSELVNGERLVEIKDDYGDIIYAVETEPKTIYRIGYHLFTYDENLPLLNMTLEKIKNKKELISPLSN